MYKKDDTVLYGNEGVCRVTDTMTRKFKDHDIEYYVLKPIYSQNATIYVPIDNEQLTKKMKRILSAEEIMTMIKTMPDVEDIWIQNDNQRKEKYKEIIRNGDRLELIQLIKTLYQHQQKLKMQGKKFHATDERFFKDAEKIIYEEFAYVLNIKQDEVIPFINQQIDVQEKREA